MIEALVGLVGQQDEQQTGRFGLQIGSGDVEAAFAGAALAEVNRRHRRP